LSKCRIATYLRTEAVQVWDGRLNLHVKVAGEGPPLVFFHALFGLAWEPLLDQLAGQHTVPTRVAWGRQDALVPVAYAAEFGRSIAGSQVEIIDDCGHVMQADQPEAVWTVVSKFLSA
jgi:pimeloyl-ACP methyl ester carboxylesterase